MTGRVEEELVWGTNGRVEEDLVWNDGTSRGLSVEYLDEPRTQCGMTGRVKEGSVWNIWTSRGLSVECRDESRRAQSVLTTETSTRTSRSPRQWRWAR